MRRLQNLLQLAFVLTLVLSALGVSGAHAQTYSNIHDFNTTTLTSPQNAGILAQGRDGNLYGTTPTGGTHGFGGVFKITPAGAFNVIYNFDGTAAGKSPRSGITLGTDGNFYGTTSGGGTVDGGVAFKLTPAKVLTVLHNFDSRPGSKDAYLLDAGLIQATDGNFYGVSAGGGANGLGALYKITGAGTYSVLYSFVLATGSAPQTTLRQHTNGKFYGETNAGGGNSLGTIFSFDVGLKPFISELPTSGKVAKSVGILGGGFTGTTSVNFNVTNATFTVVSNTYLSTTVPSGATTGFVTPNALPMYETA